MELTLEAMILYLLLIDAIAANVLAFSGGRSWWRQNFRLISRYFPLTRGWTSYYLILVLLMGALLIRAGVSIPPLS